MAFHLFAPRLVVLVFCLQGLVPFAAAEESVDAATLFSRHAEFESVAISPSGKYLAVTQRKDNIERLLVLFRETLKPRFVTHYGEDLSIGDLIWANDDLILIQPAIRVPWYFDGEQRTGEIISLDLKSKRSKYLFGYKAGTSSNPG